MNYFKPISISLSPNVEKNDLYLALNLIIRPWLWIKGKKGHENGIENLENAFKIFLGVKYAVSFNSGRSAFYAILKALDLGQQNNVAIQSFTCNAVPNPILWAGLEPLYIDCNKDDLNISADDLKAKINARTRAVVVQHAFGMPAQMDKIREICSQNNLILIEDCAHSLGAEYNGIKVGSHSRVAFFSFSRDKIISSVYGGMAVTNDLDISEKLRQQQEKFGPPSYFWTFQQLLHPILLQYIILPIYSFLSLGKLILIISQFFHLLSKAVSWNEKRGIRPEYFPKALPNALAILALNQFNKLEKFNSHRQKIAEFYYNNLANSGFILPERFLERRNVYLRFVLRHKDAHSIIYKAWHKHNMLLGDWYTTPVAPFDTKVEEIKYIEGSCKNAENLAKRTLNLPTHINISIKDAERIVNFLKKYN
jgi:dTDP-4-amino-4,6-dideoxygalactose transaminase